MIRDIYIREEDGSSNYTDDAFDIARTFQGLVEAYIKDVESDGKVDLRDLNSLLTGVVTDVILSEIINRRLS
ncbi:MAG: hypothetical protein CMQ41_07920 [Gammaproteobacteria bacterium]|nr:hypothetical protein [Gammaproteobacteria bacterium]|tara:strand:+ start:643 stop:858 length:216 start_codon:yes stop_codon:yes gene_type:complete